MALVESSRSVGVSGPGNDMKTHLDPGGEHIQAVAVNDDSGDHSGISGNPLYVQGAVTVAALPLPAGAATAAKQLADGHGVIIQEPLSVDDNGASLSIDVGGVAPQMDDTDKVAVSLYAQTTNPGDTPLEVDAQARLLVNVAGRQITIVQTPTITAGAYTAGDALGGLLEFAGAAVVAGGSGIIAKVVIIDDDQEDQPIDLVFFDRTFTATADNAPFDPTDVDMQNCIGVVSIAATDYADFADNGVATKRNVGFPFVLNGTSLFGQMRIGDVGGYAATDDLTVKITIFMD